MAWTHFYLMACSSSSRMDQCLHADTLKLIFLALSFIRIRCHFCLLLSPGRSRSNSMVQKENFYNSLQVHNSSLPSSTFYYCLSSLLIASKNTSDKYGYLHLIASFPWLFLPNQDQSLPWLPRGTMLLVFYSLIFEAHHQCESYFALNSKGVLIYSIMREETVLMQATLEGNFSLLNILDIFCII